MSYGWDFGDGTGGVGRTVEHTYASDGTFVVVLTVTDNRGGTGSATSSVVTTNQAPVADFSALQARTCELDASASSDVDGSIVSYDWDFGDGTGGVGRTVEHTYGSDGTFVVVLTVS